MIARLGADLSPRSAVPLAVLLAVFLLAPFFVNDYLLTVLILILYFAYAGQAWNIMMGFAGQLSLGHAIYVGLGAYVAATLFTRYGVGPWIGLLAAIPVAAACGAIIGYLAFRFGVAGVYFAILTIAFAEFARIGFDHLDFVNASSGLFLPVKQYAHNDLWLLRGAPTMFYYVILAATVFAFLLCRLLLHSRIGYFWLAIREDEQAARAAGIDTFRYKMYAVMVSAAVTSFAGVFYAFFYNNLFPEQVFGISRSIEIILGPIIGGVGTLFGPILGAFVLTGLARDAATRLMGAFGVDLPGAKQVFYGVCLPARRPGAAGRRVAAAGAPAWPDRGRRNDRTPHRRGGQQALPRPARGRPRQLRRAARRDLRHYRPERRRQDHAVQHHRRRPCAERRHHHLRRRAGRSACRRTPSAGAASPAPSRSCGRSRR